ncbi:CRISPR-associated Cas3 family helicase [Hypnocyclicus thermotrophus]|uniref:CRISPR-associated Cas3 family helicase n=1 Tax=Hypnocyclicus thermotrophus TaxID=1627895 RepID=A0AA46I4V7_9FUSO|nr:CRISPR-associated helicase Cas3' [Hypnocyclicus thermotrophus]TDT67027.1 CRISPR-associated Cas3 family helicase [Hypnocyclicus thermotrophus]
MLYLAKSNPRETIQEHTDKLLENYNILKDIYPNLEINWDILKLACIYHDLGKMNSKFQKKLKTGKRDKDEVAHNILSIGFVDTKRLKDIFQIDEIRVLLQAIAYHHERGEYDLEKFEEELDLMKEEIKNFVYDKIQIESLKKPSIKYFNNSRIREKENEELFYKYIMIKGLLNRIDYAASSDIKVEIENVFLNKSLDSWREKKQVKWNELQVFMGKNQNENVIVVAQTGMGKTEAGLRWIGNNKGFFTLPLKTAINKIYERIKDEIIEESYSEKIGVLHSDTYSEYVNLNEDDLDIENYYTKTKQLSMPLTISTLDQLFNFVFRYRGFEPILATLSYSKIVIDEIQMYSYDLIAYLVLGLYYISRLGGKFAILTATLPEFLLDIMKEEKISFKRAERDFINEKVRHSIKIEEKEINAEDIIEKYNKNKILVICNTVKKAQEMYQKLIDNNIEKVELLHSRFIKKDRKVKEKRITELGKIESKDYGIWVSTQIVEASLDIDYDLLFTELSDLNSLFQRMGRCYRKREFKEETYNCFVFNGGEKKCSGVGQVIDRDIFQFSKDILKEVDGKIDEKKKLELINRVYSTEKIKDTKYYELIKKNISYVKKIDDYEKSKTEVRNMFRNIESVTIIPKKIYRENKIEIDENLEILEKVNQKDNSAEERKALRREKELAKIEILKFSVSIPYYAFKNGTYDEMIKINKYEILYIFDCEYSKDVGVSFKNKKNKIDPFDC